MEFSEVVRRRRMVRSYTDEPVDPAVVERALEHATRAPSAGFSQGWAFVVLDRPEDVRRFWAASTDSLDEPDQWLAGMMRAPVVIVPCSVKAAYLDRYAEPDKGWTDRSERTLADAVLGPRHRDGGAADPADGDRRRARRLLLRHRARPRGRGTTRARPAGRRRSRTRSARSPSATRPRAAPARPGRRAGGGVLPGPRWRTAAASARAGTPDAPSQPRDHPPVGGGARRARAGAARGSPRCCAPTGADRAGPGGGAGVGRADLGGAVPGPGGLRRRAVPARRRRAGPRPAGLAGRRHVRDPGRDRVHRHRPELADLHGRELRDGRPPRRPLRAPPEDGAGVLHRHQDRRHPEPAGQRRRRRPHRADRHRDDDRAELGDGDRRAGVDGAAVVAADHPHPDPDAAVRVAAAAGRPAPAAAGAAHPGVALGDDGDHRGGAQRLGDPARQGLQPLAAGGRPLPRGQPAADPAPGRAGDDRPHLLRRRADVLRDHAGADLPGRRLDHHRYRRSSAPTSSPPAPWSRSPPCRAGCRCRCCS